MTELKRGDRVIVRCNAHRRNGQKGVIKFIEKHSLLPFWVVFKEKFSRAWTPKGKKLPNNDGHGDWFGPGEIKKLVRKVR